MEIAKSAPPSKLLERCDVTLLAAYLLVAALGTWQSCLLVIDGAVFLTAAWLGNAWDLFFDQIAGRAMSTLFQFGPAWLLRPAFGSSSQAFLVVAHALYFTAPLGLWLVLRDYGSRRMTFAFYTFFRSDRRAVAYRLLGQRGEWIPFECAPVDRAVKAARDNIDRRFLGFLRERYCVPN